jgi:CBS domain-containing protein
MTVGVPTCKTDFPIVKLSRIMLEKDWEAVVVLDEHGHAVGMVSRDELIYSYGKENVHHLRAEETMRDGLPQVPPDIPLMAAAQIMQDMGVRVLFMTHHAGGIEYPAAMLTYKHLLRHLSMENLEDLGDLGINAKRDPPLESFIRRRDALLRDVESKGKHQENH